MGLGATPNCKGSIVSALGRATGQVDAGALAVGTSGVELGTISFWQQ